MLKKFILFATMICSSILYASVKPDPAPPPKFVVPNGIPAISIANLLKETSFVYAYDHSPDTKLLSHKINGQPIIIDIIDLPSELVTTLSKNEPHIAIVPSTLAAQLYNKGLDYRILGTVGWGSFYMISKDKISSWKELKGKKIAAIGKGLTPDIVLQTLMTKNNLDPKKDVTIDYYQGPNELIPVFFTKKADVIVISEPILSALDEKISTENLKSTYFIDFDLNEEWKKVFKSKYGYPQSTLIVNNIFYMDHKEFMDEFMRILEKSTRNIDINEMYNDLYLFKIYGRNLPNINFSVKDIKNPMPFSKDRLEVFTKRANINFKKIGETKESYNDYYKIINAHNSKVIGGKIPDEEIYITQ